MLWWVIVERSVTTCFLEFMFVFVTFAITKIRDYVKKRKHNYVKRILIFLVERQEVY